MQILPGKILHELTSAPSPEYYKRKQRALAPKARGALSSQPYAHEASIRFRLRLWLRTEA